MALRLENTTGVPARIWDLHETEYQATLARQAAERSCTLGDFPAYDRDKLEAALPALRSLTVEDPVQAIQRAQALLRNCGVALTLVPAMPGLGTHGATRWIQYAWGHSLKRKVTITSLAV